MSHSSYKYLANCIYQNQEIAGKDDKTAKWWNIDKGKNVYKFITFVEFNYWK